MNILLILIPVISILIFSSINFVNGQESTKPLPEGKDIQEWHAIAIALISENRYEESLYYFDRILNEDPNHTSSLLNKGVTLQRLDRYDQAIVYFDRLLEIEPNHIKALTNKASTLEDMGKFAESAEIYNDALSLDENNKTVKEKLAKVLSSTPTVPCINAPFFGNLVDPKYEINIRVTVRNSGGELISVVESTNGRYLPVGFTDYVFYNAFDNKEIVTINDQRFDIVKKSQTITPSDDAIGLFTMDSSLSGYKINVFEAFTTLVVVEPDDEIYVEWVISRKSV